MHLPLGGKRVEISRVPMDDCLCSLSLSLWRVLLLPLVLNDTDLVHCVHLTFPLVLYDVGMVQCVACELYFDLFHLLIYEAEVLGTDLVMFVRLYQEFVTKEAGEYEPNAESCVVIF